MFQIKNLHDQRLTCVRSDFMTFHMTSLRASHWGTFINHKTTRVCVESQDICSSLAPRPHRLLLRRFCANPTRQLQRLTNFTNQSVLLIFTNEADTSGLGGGGEEKQQQHEFGFNKTTSQPDSDQTAHIQSKDLELLIK